MRSSGQLLEVVRVRSGYAILEVAHQQTVITPTPDGANGSIYMFLLDVGEQPPAPSVSYIYEDALVKTPAGWRFKARVLRREDHT
jgi:hypothetical protein